MSEVESKNDFQLRAEWADRVIDARYAVIDFILQGGVPEDVSCFLDDGGFDPSVVHNVLDFMPITPEYVEKMELAELEGLKHRIEIHNARRDYKEQTLLMEASVA